MVKSLGKEIKALLFDLDGTLIQCDINIFTANYLKSLGEALSSIIAPKLVLKGLLKASSEIENNKGQAFNEEIFRKVFFPIIKHPEEKINPLIDKYYENEFPKLSKFFEPQPDARVLMVNAFKRGYKVIIATTPVLPEVAIKERLRWAGIDDFPYDLITTIENSRSTKTTEHLVYYEQILDKIGLPGEACIMIGDEAKDMMAAKLGCQTFLITSPNTNLHDHVPKPTYRGTLADLNEML